jgi:hypothetical protein
MIRVQVKLGFRIVPEQVDCYAILDTNSVLHYQTPDQIPWDKMLGARSPGVMLSMSLLRELDKKTHEGSPGVKERAEKRSRWVKERFRRKDSTLRAGELLFETRQHGIDLVANGLDPARADDNFIAEVIARKKRDPGVRCVLITHDVALQIIAPGFDVETVEIPSEFQKPVEEQVDKELRRLRTEIEQLRNRLPRVAVRFTDGDTRFEFDSAPPVVLPEDEITRQLLRAQEETPSLVLGTTTRPVIVSGELMVPHLEPEQIDSYNQARDRYLQKLESYLRTGRMDDPVFLALPIGLYNDGTSPAAGTTLTLRFRAPSGVVVSQHAVEYTNEPSPPEVPQPAGPLNAYLSSMSSVAQPWFEPPLILRPDDPRISWEGNDTIVTYRDVGTLNHQHYRSLSLHVTFDHRSLARSFSIEWSVFTVSLPDQVTGRLDVVLRSKEKR